MNDSGIGNSNRIWMRKPVVVLTAIIAVAAFLRLFQISGHPLSMDETYTLTFSDYPWSTFYASVSDTDVHPPLYYAIIKVFRSIGLADAPFAMRLPSAIFSILTVPLLFGISKNLFERREYQWVGIVSMLLFAFSAVHISISQYARSYSLMVFAMTLSVYGGTWFLNNSSRFEEPIRLWRKGSGLVSAIAATIVGFSLLLWSHNIGLIYAGTTGLSIFLLLAVKSNWNVRALSVLAACGALAILFWLPNLLAVIGQASNVSDQYWIPPLTAGRFARYLFEAFGVVAFSPFSMGTAALLSLPIMLFSVLGLWKLWRTESWKAVFFAIVIGAPIVLFAVISFVIQPIFILRILHPLFPIWIILVAFGSHKALERRSPKIGTAIAAILFGITGLSYHLSSEKSEPWDEIVEAIDRNSKPGSMVLTVPNISAMPIGYYSNQLDTGLIIEPIPADFPARQDHYTYPTGLPGAPAVNAEMIESAFSKIVEGDKTDAWIVLRGYQIYDQGGLVKPALDQRFCYQKLETEVPYIMVLKLIPLGSELAETCNYESEGTHF